MGVFILIESWPSEGSPGEPHTNQKLLILPSGARWSPIRESLGSRFTRCDKGSPHIGVLDYEVKTTSPIGEEAIALCAW